MRIASPCLCFLHRSLFVFECGEYSVIVMAGQVNVSLNISDGASAWSVFSRRCELYRLIINGFVLAVIVIVGIIGNCLTFVVFWKGNFKSSTSFLFLGLSLADSALLLTSVPVDIVGAFVSTTDWLQGFRNVEPYMRVYGPPLYLVARMASIWVTVLIAVNRYIIVCVPLRASQWCTLTNVKTQLVVVVVVAVMCSIPGLLGCRVVHSTKNNGTSYDTYVDYSTTLEWRAFYEPYNVVINCILLSSVPLFILTLLTVRLIKAMKAHRRMQLEMNRVSSQQDSSVTSSFIIVVIVFIIGHTLRVVENLWWYLGVLSYHTTMDEVSIEVYVFMRELSSMLVILNSGVNFAIYTLACKSFRDVLIENVCRRRTDMQVVIAHRAEGVNDEPDDDHDTPL